MFNEYSFEMRNILPENLDTYKESCMPIFPHIGRKLYLYWSCIWFRLLTILKLNYQRNKNLIEFNSIMYKETQHLQHIHIQGLGSKFIQLQTYLLVGYHSKQFGFHSARPAFFIYFLQVLCGSWQGKKSSWERIKTRVPIPWFVPSSCIKRRTNWSKWLSFFLAFSYHPIKHEDQEILC